MVKKALIGAAIAAALVGGGAGVASAGEIAGNGTRPQPMSGNSWCSFSGQNDEFHEEEGTWPRVQSFGQEVKFFASIKQVSTFAHENGGVGIPGTECNGSLAPRK